MIVRLKERLWGIYGEKGVEFQFYDSPIKRLTTGHDSAAITWFQFYDSPIKRQRQSMV